MGIIYVKKDCKSFSITNINTDHHKKIFYTFYIEKLEKGSGLYPQELKHIAGDSVMKRKFSLKKKKELSRKNPFKFSSFMVAGTINI